MRIYTISLFIFSLIISNEVILTEGLLLQKSLKSELETNRKINVWENFSEKKVKKNDGN